MKELGTPTEEFVQNERTKKRSPGATEVIIVVGGKYRVGALNNVEKLVISNQRGEVILQVLEEITQLESSPGREWNVANYIEFVVGPKS